MDVKQFVTYEKEKEREGAIRAFSIVLTIYVIVNAALFAIDQFTAGGPWFYWPLIGWGVALVINAVIVFAGLTPGSEAEERAIRRYLETHAGQS